MANDPIRVGIIGLGSIGKTHARAYQLIPLRYKEPTIHAKVAAVMRTRIGADDDFLEFLGNPYVTSDPSNFFEQDLDMVDICTPNLYHLDGAKSAITHNLNLYIEKPLGWNLQHAHEIAKLADAAGVLSHTAFNNRYLPAVNQAKAILESGVLGEIYNFRVHFFHNSYMDPNRPISWRLQHAYSGGGALADLGIHIIDMMRYLLGEAIWVQGRTQTFIQQRPKTLGNSEMIPVDVDDWGLLTVGLKNGALGTIEATRMSGGFGNSTRMEIFASNGNVVVDDRDPYSCEYYDQAGKQNQIGSREFQPQKGVKDITSLWPDAKIQLNSFEGAHSACIYDFLQCIQEGKTSMLNFNDAVKTQEVLEAGYISAGRDGETIRLPLN